MLFQLTKAILFSCCLCPHQNLLISPSISSQSPLGSWQQLMLYVGMAWATAFIRTSLPPMDKSFSFHLDSFFGTLSFISAKTSFFDFAMIKGRPRYFSCLVSCIGPNISSTSLLVSFRVLWLKNIEDLSTFIFCPEATSYRLRISTNFWHSCYLLCKIRGCRLRKIGAWPKDILNMHTLLINTNRELLMVVFILIL